MADISSNPVVDWGGIMAGAQLTRDQSGLAQANTALVNQQTQGAQIANARAAIGYQLYRNAVLNMPGQYGSTADTSNLSNLTGVAPPADDIGQSPADPAHVDIAMRNRFWVDPTGTPQEKQFLGQAALSGDDGLLKAATTMRDLGVQQRLANSQYEANNYYEAMSAVESADPGRAFAQLQAVAPKSAAQLEKLHPDATDDELDEITRDWVAHTIGVAHQYTGREVTQRTDGVYVDKTTGLPVSGVPTSGLSEQQYGELYKQANALVSVKQSDGTEVQEPQWKANKAPSAAAWISNAASQWQAQQSLPSHPAFSGTPMEQPGFRPPPPSSPGQPGTPANAPNGAATASQPTADSQLGKALRDPDYKLNTPPVRAGVSQSPAQQKEAEAVVGARQDLMKDANDATGAAATSLQYLQAAKSIMASHGATVGAYGGLVNQASRLLGGGPKSTDYAELAKYLGNAALAGAKSMYGAKMTQGEVRLQLEELSPSTHMTDDAINDLLDTNIKSAQYTISSARAVRPYLSSGNDPRSFNSWREQYWPRAESVNPKPAQTTTTKAPAVGTVSKGYRFTGGDPSKPSSWAKVTQ